MRPAFPSGPGGAAPAIVTMAVLFALTLVALVAAATAEDYARTLAVAEARSRAASLVLAEHARRVVAAGDQVLAGIVHRIRGAGTAAPAGAVGTSELSRLAATLPESTVLEVVRPDGTLLSSSRPLPGPTLEPANITADGLHIGPMIRDPIDGKAAFTLSRGVWSPSGRLLATVVAIIVPTYISDYLSWSGDGVAVTFSLYRDDGIPVVRMPPQPQLSGKNHPVPWMFSHFPRQQEATARVVSAWDGSRRIAAFRKVRDLPLLACASLEAEAVFHDWWRRLWRNAALTGLALGGLAGLTLYALRAYRRECAWQIRSARASARLAFALDAAQAAVWEWNAETGDMDWTPGNWRLLGLDPATPASHAAWWDCIASADQPRIAAAMAEAERERRSHVALEYRVDGGRRWLLASVNLAFDTTGRLLRKSGVILDITRRKETEARLAAARRDAERAIHAKSHFLAAASHDLRQPAQSLALLLPALLPQVEGTPARKVVAVMEQAVEALNALLAGLLDVSRLDAQLVVPETRKVVVGGLLSRLGRDYAAQAAQRGLRLRWVPSAVEISTDPALLERILRNLVENALRFTRRGGIVLGCRRRAGRVAIVVVDTGPGIPADQLDAVFEEFVQLHNQARDRAHGLGLGLAVVRRLAELLGAELEVRSVPGRGSSFGVALAT